MTKKRMPAGRDPRSDRRTTWSAARRICDSYCSRRGMDVTQATLSRDLRDLHLARISESGGARYVLPESLVPDDDKPLLATLLPQLFSRVDGVGELVVLHTVASGAQPIAEAIDQEEFPEVLGTIAGDDTILIVTRSAAARVALTERLQALAGEG